MSQYGITVDTGPGRHGYSEGSLLSFYRNAGLAQAALEAMKASVRGLRAGIQGATRCLTRMGTAVQGVLSGLMNARSVADGLQAGMKSLHRYSRTWWRSFAGTLQKLAANAAYLKNSLAAMAAPLMQALAPAIEYVTDKFVGLFNLINQFFARLTGASTYVAAKRAAGGLHGVGDAASYASNAVKALERQLADFDDLSVLSAPDTGSGGSGGGSGGAGIEFEERQIESGLAGFVDALKAAFEAGDWPELGSLIGAKINEMIEDIDWSAAGAKVGYYVNGLFSTAYWTLDTVNFENIGARVAEFLNSALAEIDFSTVGGTVALLLTSLAETVAGFVDEFDWLRFAEKLADGLNGFVMKLGQKLDAIDWAGMALKLTEGLNAFIVKTDWQAVGDTLGGRLNDLLAIFGTFSANFDWKGAGEALATAVNSLFRRADWDALGAWLNDALLGALDFGIAFLNGFDAEGFAGDVQRALAKVDWDAVADRLWELFCAALKKLGDFFGTLLFGGSADLKLNLGLLKDGWDTVAGWLGIDRPFSALVELVRQNWSSIASWLGIDAPLAATLKLLLGLVDPDAQEILDAGDRTATTTANLAEGRTNADAKRTLDASDKAVSVTVDSKATGDPDKVVKVAGISADAVNKAVNTSSKAGGDADKVLDVAGVTKDKVEKTVNTSSKAGGDADKVLDVSKVTKDKVEKTVNTSSKAGGSADKVLDVSKVTKDKVAKTVNTSSKAGGDDDKVLKLANIGSNTLKKNVDTKSSAHGEANKVLDVSRITKTAVTKNVTVKAMATGQFSQIYRIYTTSNSLHKTVTVDFKATGDSAAQRAYARGGVITSGGRSFYFATGGVISGSVARYLEGVPHYAGGTARAHGTVFVAGEAGPEIMGHINGRTEILNRSQLAQTMYSAVLSAMGQAVSALGTFLSGQLANCANAVVTAIGNREQGTGNRNGWGFAGLNYHEPAMASGTVLPYDVAARIARTGMDIQNTLDANNEDLIQTIVSVAGQIVAAVQAQGRREQPAGATGRLTAQQLIDDINRRTQMFGGSPLLE